LDIHREITRMQTAGEAGVHVLVTSVDGHTPQVVGARMIVTEDGEVQGTIGGGRLEREVIECSREVLASGLPATRSFQLKTELGMCCGGQMEVYMEPIVARERLIIFGAGHVGAATARLATECDFDVTVVDVREEWNNSERIPGEVNLERCGHEDFLAGLEGRPRDYLVIVTHNHDHDREILARLVTLDVGYVGMIGSTRKVQKTLRRLELEGIPKEELAPVHAPIGLDICAETPAEIAVAIVGEMIRVRRESKSLKKTRGAPVTSISDRSVERLRPAESSGGGEG
jgi:xanthine dehydrogenase accessory factor